VSAPTASRSEAASASPSEVFRARAEARAVLWAVGELDLHEAVDKLLADAERDGLVAAIGEDAVQQILADAFAPHRDDLMPANAELAESEPIEDTFAAACRAADEKQRRKPRDPHLDHLRALMADDVSLPHAIAEMQHHRLANRAAASTVEALMFSLRERGVAALSERDCRRRLAELSTAQVRDVIRRLMVLRPRYPTITDELLFQLGEQLR
jgi:hypothetical protein